jgi:hypothetical protein
MEVERLRKKAADRPVDEVEVVSPAAIVRPAPPPPPPPRPVVRARPRLAETPEPTPVLDVLPVQQSALAPVQSVAPVTAPFVQPTQRVAAVTAGPRRGAASREVLALMRSRQHLRAAIVLQEILGPPLSRRRR